MPPSDDLTNSVARLTTATPCPPEDLVTRDDNRTVGGWRHAHGVVADGHGSPRSAAIFLDDREFVCPAGSFIFIPAGLPHAFRVGGMAIRKLNLYTPAAMVGYFDDVAAATKAGDVDPDSLSEIALRYSMEVIGPVPEAYV